MEIERDVKPQPAGDSEATWSPGPRTTTKIPYFTDDQLGGLADENEKYGDIDLKQVSDSLDSLFGKLPDSSQQAPGTAVGKGSGFLNWVGNAIRTSTQFFGKLGFSRSAG